MENVAPALLARLSASGELLASNARHLDARWFGGDVAGIERALRGRASELLDAAGGSDEPLALRWRAGGRLLVTAFVRVDDPGAVGSLDTVTIDVSQLPGGPEELSRRDDVDRLTGLATRAAIIERLSTVIRRAARDGTVAAVMVVDLDDPAALGDEVAGEALGDATRAGDVIGRLDDGQFAVVFGSPLGEAEARIVADRVLGTIPDVHVGLAFTDAPRTAAGLLDEARAAVSLARSTGASRVFVVDDEFRDDLDWAGRRVAELRLAIELDQFAVVYQPVVDLLDGSTNTFEALVRWNHPLEGELSPERFVPLAERTGLMSLLSDLVISRVIEHLRAHAEAAPTAVNVTAVDLLRPGFADRLLQRLETSGVDPSRFRLELTESAVLADPVVASQVIGSLRDAGVGVALDDFGTGESSLALLTTLPVDCLKIDRAFVAGLLDSPADQAVVRLVVGLGRELGLKVVAEGIETVGQRDAVASLGCRFAQGYLFRDPLEAPPS